MENTTPVLMPLFTSGVQEPPLLRGLLSRLCMQRRMNALSSINPEPFEC